MKLLNIKCMTLVLTILLSLSAAAQVTVDTSDKKLLKGIDKSEMFEAVTPIARLSFHLEGIAEPVEVRYQDSGAVLYAHDATDDERQKLMAAFTEMTGVASVTVKDMSTLNSDFQK